MTTAIASEMAPTALPITGSGPFSLIMALIGLVAVGVGVLLRHTARFAHHAPG